MNANVQKALENIDITYDNLIQIANDIIRSLTQEIDDLIAPVYDNVENLTNEDLRGLIMKLSLKSYMFSETKEKSLFKAELAETLRKEMYATQFNQSEGSVAVRDNIALLNSSAEFLAEEIHNLVSQLFKTKSDEIHRVVDSAKTVLMARLSEAKLSSVEVI